ncbi:MAG: polymer-forming cytoskeletal protein [Candidatus Omnitrophica bacterium]|jgi:excisionase family DNA binding protein|nr:polymer-forming cytoskeletal protein [Candidatus Omnitrophota bacterium]MDD4013331.1 polymer-forming cytoskeletal protein [Candidatus Omnitrophota bacterium]
MRYRRREERKAQEEERVLEVSAGMQGTLRFEDPVNLKINGKFDGMLEAKGTLVIGGNAVVNANIIGETVTISGQVNGNIKASSFLRLEQTAKVTGDIETIKISVAEGAILTGQLRMGGHLKSGHQQRGDWMSMTQLAKYLEIDAGKVNEWASNGKLPATREGGEWVFDKEKIDRWISEGKVKA